MTSNIGSQQLLNGINDEGEISEEARELVLQLLRQTFRPELLNRIDETVLFRPLGTKDLARIVDIALHDLNRRLEERAARYRDPRGVELYRERLNDPRFGARPLRRFLQRSRDAAGEKAHRRRAGRGRSPGAAADGRPLTFSMAS